MINKRRMWAWVFSVLEIAWLGFIFSNSLKSRAASAEQSKPLEDFIKPPLDAMGFEKGAEHLAEIIVRKGAHIAEFFVLTLLCVLALHFWGKSTKRTVLIGLACGFVAASTDEALQIISNRGAAFTDVLIDMIGVTIAVGSAVIFGAVKKRFKKGQGAI